MTWWIYTFLIILVITLICFWFRNFRKHRSNLLSSKIEEEVKKMAGGDIKRKSYEYYLEQLYFPSKISLGVVFLCFIILFVLSRITPFWPFPLSILQYDTSAQFQNLIAIHAGIGAIIFALLIFVAESLRDDTKDRARVLLRESFLFPLTVSEIISFFIFIWGHVNFFSVVPVVIVGILTIMSLFRLLRVLLSKSEFAAKRLKLLKDNIYRSIDSAIKERLGTNIFLKKLDEDGLKYNPFSPDEDDKATRKLFYVDKPGLVSDIRLDKLKELGNLIETVANENGYSFYENKLAPSGAVTGAADGATSTPKKYLTKYSLRNEPYIHKKYGDNVEIYEKRNKNSDRDDDERLILSVDISTIKDVNVFEKISNLIREIFIIKTDENFSEEIKFEIAGLKGQFIDAINERRVDKIETLSKTYIALAESFLEAIDRYGGGYSYEQAKKERGDLFGGWNEVKWLSDTMRDILRKAVSSQDHDTVREIAYIPVAIAIRAIKFLDQYLFQEFLEFPILLYFLALEEQPGELRKFMVDRSWRHLKEMSDYYVEFQLKRKLNDVGLIEKYAQFTLPIFLSFQRLLKTAFDNKDYASFEIFLNAFSGMYAHLESENNHPNAAFLEQSLTWTDDVDQKKIIQKQLVVQKEKEKVTKNIIDKKAQIIFGLTGFIFDKCKSNPLDADTKKFYEKIVGYLPNRLPEFTALYISLRNFETEDRLGWDNWEVIPDGEVHMIDVHGKFDRLYCVRALQMLKNMTNEQIESISLPTSRDFAFLAEDRADNHTLTSILNDITAHPEQWAFVLDTTAIEKIPALKGLLKKVKDQQEKSEDEFLQTVEISSAKLAEFKEKIKTAFYESPRLRVVAERVGIYHNLIDEDPGKTVPSYGYNQLDTKAAFIENWHVHYGGWGDTYGTGMANSEDQIVFKEMVDGVAIKKDITQENLVSEIEKVITENNYQNPIVFQTLGYISEYQYLKQSPSFMERYRKDFPKTDPDFRDLKSFYFGVLDFNGKKVSIFDVFVRDENLKNKIIVTDFAKLGVWNQYTPVDKPADKAHVYDIFFLQVHDLNKDTTEREKLITANPPWLNSQTNKEAYLKSHVVVRLYQKFKFEIKNPKAGACLNIVIKKGSEE